MGKSIDLFPQLCASFSLSGSIKKRHFYNTRTHRNRFYDYYSLKKTLKTLNISSSFISVCEIYVRCYIVCCGVLLIISFLFLHITNTTHSARVSVRSFAEPSLSKVGEKLQIHFPFRDFNKYCEDFCPHFFSLARLLNTHSRKRGSFGVILSTIQQELLVFGDLR